MPWPRPCRRAAAPGQFIAYAGSDIARGELVLRRGTRISSREIGMLAACGIEEIDVVRRPRVAVLSTGDELIEAGRPLTRASLYDANRTLLGGMIEAIGGSR